MHDPRATTGDKAEPLRGIGAAEREDELLRHRVDVEGVRGRGEADVARHDLFVDAHRVGVPEGRLPDQHLVHEDAQRPPVHRHAVTLVADHLGREVFGRAAEGVGDASAVGVGAGFAAATAAAAFAGTGAVGGWGWGEVFGEAEVDEFEVPVGV